MLVAKLIFIRIILMSEFENYVNYAGSKTYCECSFFFIMFENYVNYAGSKTSFKIIIFWHLFENYVNYAGSKTDIYQDYPYE